MHRSLDDGATWVGDVETISLSDTTARTILVRGVTDDLREGFNAFAEKRDPQWRGR